MSPLALAALAGLLFLVAALYASVGHGGASGYLAILSFFAFAPAEMATTALTLNVLVAGAAFLSFRAAGHFQRSLLVSFAVASIPAAFVGGTLQVSPRYYAGLLALALVVAALRMAWPKGGDGVDRTADPIRAPSMAVALPTGAGVGLLSGIVGVGGGVFLSPLLIFLRWATVRETAGVAAAFIVVNSVSGLLGRALGGTLAYGPLLWILPAVVAGGFLGARFGARRLTPRSLRLLLAGVLLLAAFKLAVLGL